MASLARLFKCPVVSNDSDMLLFDLPEGVISVDDLDISAALSRSPRFATTLSVNYCSTNVPHGATTKIVCDAIKG